MIRAVFFDAGNTLVGIDYTLLAAAAGGLDPEKIREGDRILRPVLNARLARSSSTEAGDIFDQYHGGMLRHAGLPEAEVRPTLTRLRSVERIMSTWRRPNPEARPAVAALERAGCRVAVISNSDGRVASLLAACGLDGLFAVILDSRLEGLDKPDPRLFLRGCERLGVGPEESAYIGDIPSIDVTGSRAAGLTPVLYDPLDAFTGWSESRRIRDLRELPAMLGLGMNRL